MNKDRYEAIIKDLSSPDKVQSAIIDLIDELNKDYAENEGLVNKKSELERTVNTLRDTNSKLVLRITEPSKNNEPEVEKTPSDYLEDLRNNIIGGGK